MSNGRKQIVEISIDGLYNHLVRLSKSGGLAEKFASIHNDPSGGYRRNINQNISTIVKRFTDFSHSIKHEQPNHHQYNYFLQHICSCCSQLLTHLSNHPFLPLRTCSNLHIRGLLFFFVYTNAWLVLFRCYSCGNCFGFAAWQLNRVYYLHTFKEKEIFCNCVASCITRYLHCPSKPNLTFLRG